MDDLTRLVMQRVVITLLCVLGVFAGVVLVKFGTLDPCGIVRAQIRQEAVREGPFAQVIAAVVSDSVIDAMVASQYGQLSPGRCIALAFAGAPPPPKAPIVPPVQPGALVPPKPPANQPAVAAPNARDALKKQANAQATAAMAECKNKRLSGEIKTYVASVECSNPKIIEAYWNADYRYMDLITLMTKKRRELAEKVDNGKITDAQFAREFDQFLLQISDTERQRDRSPIPCSGNCDPTSIGHSE